MIDDDRLPTKKAFIDYLKLVPIYRRAADAVFKSEDTMLNWRNEDDDFSAQCEAAIAECLKRHVRKARPEFILERLFKDEFAQRHEHTGKDGEPIQVESYSYENLTRWVVDKAKQVKKNGEEEPTE